MNCFRKIVLIMIAFTNVAANAGLGSEGVGGGDAYSLEFIRMANRIRILIEVELKDKFDEIEISILKKAIQETEVITVSEELYLNGVVKDALNYPSEKRILVNRSRLERTMKDRNSFRSLVFHEYLGIISVSDKNYYLSIRLAELLEIERDKDFFKVQSSIICDETSSIPYFSWSSINFLTYFDINLNYDQCHYKLSSNDYFSNQIKNGVKRFLKNREFVAYCMNHSVGGSILSLVHKGADGSLQWSRGTVWDGKEDVEFEKDSTKECIFRNRN